MLATRNLSEEQIKAGMMVALPSETSKGLSKTEIEEVKLRVQLSREAGETAGNALMACAEHLSAVKAIVKKKGWTALCDSGSLGMSSKQAQRLALCHERLFVTGSVPSTSVSNVSITTLYLMASADDKKRKEMVAACVAAGGSGFTEKQARDIRNKGKNLKKVVDLTSDDIFNKVTEKSKSMSKEELVEALIKSEQKSFDNQMKYGQYKVYSERLVGVLKKEKLDVPLLPDVIDLDPA